MPKIWIKLCLKFESNYDQNLNVFCVNKAGSSEVHHENVPSAQLLGAGGSGSNLPESDPTRFQGSGMNEQIMVALLRLQQDMNDALARLHNIETLVHQQVEWISFM